MESYFSLHDQAVPVLSPGCKKIEIGFVLNIQMFAYSFLQGKSFI